MGEVRSGRRVGGKSEGGEEKNTEEGRSQKLGKKKKAEVVASAFVLLA